MRCPSCHRPVDHEAESCYSCGFSEEQAVRRFGSNRVGMKQIHDAANCLRVSDLEAISEVLSTLEEKFPQVQFAVYLGELGNSIPLGELGFWLLNHSEIESEESRSNECGILLLVDLTRKQAGLSLGYLTELLLSEEDCFRALMAGRSFLVNGEMGPGIVKIFQKMEKFLRKSARQLKGMSREEVWLNLEHRGMNSLVLPEPFEGLGRVPEEIGTREPEMVKHLLSQ